MPDLKLHCLAVLQTVLEEHDIVDGDIDDFSLRGDRSFIGHNEGFLDMVVFILHEVILKTKPDGILPRLATIISGISFIIYALHV